MEGRVVGADIFPEDRVEVLERVDGFHVEPIEPALFGRPPEPFDFGLAGTVPHLRVEQDGPDGPADQRKLVVDIGRAVIEAIPMSG